eukprot:UN03804
MRSRSDGLISFHTAKTSKNHTPEHDHDHERNDNDNDKSDDEESDLYPSQLTPTKPSKTISLPPKHFRANLNSSLVYHSSRTPPSNVSAHNILLVNARARNRYQSDPIQVGRRSKPLSINKNKIKPHFNVDFNVTPTSYQVSSDLLFNNLTNTDSLVDDET